MQNSVSYVMFVEEGDTFGASTYLVTTQCTIWEAFSSNHLTYRSIGDFTKRIESAAIISDGENVVIAAEYYFSINDHDIAYFKTSMGVSGLSSMGFLDNSYFLEQEPYLTSEWNSGGEFSCGYLKISNGNYSAMIVKSANLAWSAPSTMHTVSSQNSNFVHRPVPAWTRNNECCTIFQRFDGNYWKIYCAYGCSNQSVMSKILNLKMFIQGFYNPTSNNMLINDTVKIYIRNLSAPYNIIDSVRKPISIAGNVSGNFENVLNNVSYYLVVKHRNSIETWSKASGAMFTNDVLNYSFALSNGEVYGANQVQVDQQPITYAIFSGDVNQDGTIDLSDIVSTYNDANNFLTGYRNTDVTGDNYVDLSDIVLIFNNSNNFVSVMRP